MPKREWKVINPKTYQNDDSIVQFETIVLLKQGNNILGSVNRLLNSGAWTWCIADKRIMSWEVNSKFHEDTMPPGYFSSLAEGQTSLEKYLKDQEKNAKTLLSSDGQRSRSEIHRNN